MHIQKKFRHIPNILSLSRVFLIPLSIFLFVSGQVDAARLIIVFSILSDFLDGYIARRLHICSDLGALIDPIADKIFACCYYIFLYVLGLIPFWLMALVVIRNFSQFLSLPILVWGLKINFKVKPKILPKYITAITSIYILIPLYAQRTFLDTPFNHVLWLLVAVGELKILIEYVPRFIQIALKKHDTFE